MYRGVTRWGTVAYIVGSEMGQHVSGETICMYHEVTRYGSMYRGLTS